MKKLTLALALAISISIFTQITVSADTKEESLLKENDLMEPYSLEDQHGVLQTLNEDTEEIILSVNMKLSKAFHKWLKEKDDSYLSDNKTDYIIDIRGMPSIITWMFAGPKMRKYGFPILLVKDGDFPDKFPTVEGKFTVLKLDSNHNISEISFIDDPDKIAEFIE